MKQTLVFGEVLFDHFPDQSRVLGGAPFNVAWNLQALGGEPCLISRIGDDAEGREIVAAMQEWQMDPSGLQTDRDHPTGMVRIEFNQGEPSFQIVPNQAYDVISRSELPADIPDSSVLYHGTLALRNIKSRKTLEHLRVEHDAKVFVDINLRPPWWDYELIDSILHSATWIKLNEDELMHLVKEGGSVEEKTARLQDRFELELAFITLGGEGAFARCADGNIFHIRPEHEISIIDTVGAGDAFASICLLGLQSNWDLNLILARAQSFASAVVGLRGAISTDREFYRHYKDAWDLQ